MRPRIPRGLLALVLLIGCVLLVVVSDHDVQGTQHTTMLAQAKVFNARKGVTLTGASGFEVKFTEPWIEASPLYPGNTWPVANKSGFVTNVLIALDRCLGSGECIRVEIYRPEPHNLYLGSFVLAQGDNSLAVDLTSGQSFTFVAEPEVYVQVTWSGLAATTIVTSILHGFDL
jgi:hypothetical protein